MNTQQSYTTNFSVDQTPEEVFTAINNVRGWWSENVEGATDQVGVSYKYRFRDLHRCEIEVTELVVGKRVAWHVAENYFSFTDDDTEWKDTDMVFDIARRDGRTKSGSPMSASSLKTNVTTPAPTGGGPTSTAA